VEVTFAGPVASAREINASEEPVGPATVSDGRLVFTIGGFAPRTFAIRLTPPPIVLQAPTSQPVELPFNLNGISSDGRRTDGDFDGQGHTIPAELLPEKLDFEGVGFTTVPTADGKPNVLTCKGQTVALPPGNWNRVYLLASAVGGDKTGSFNVVDNAGKAHETTITIQEWTGLIGQWYSRLDGSAPDGGKQVVVLGSDGKIEGLDLLKDAFVKRAPIAWIGTHRHSREENEPRIFCYLFRCQIDLPAGATSVILPDNDRIRIMAASVARTSLPDTLAAGNLCEI
jgi:alpha-mannosidase